MKNPLHYQLTEYDCGPTTLMNAVSFLFEREEIPPDVLRYVMLYCLDAYNGKGEFGKSGTSSMAMMFLSNWLNEFAKAKKFPVECEYLSEKDVKLEENSRLISALQQGGAVVVRLIYGCWHYALLTGTQGDYVDMFDPYYRKRPFRQADISLIAGEPTIRNRRIARHILDRKDKSIYALGPEESREAVILFNKNTRRTPERTIEYFI